MKEYSKKKCLTCGKEFITSNSRKKYCCDNCKAAAHRNKHKANHLKICPICGKEFIARRIIDVYCSRDCYEQSKVLYRQDHRIIKDNIGRTCPICGKEFTTKVHNKIYCSGKCKSAAYRKSHSEKELKRSRIYYQENKEKYKKWEEANRERRLRQKREYYAKHKEEKKEYAKANKERIRENKRNLHHKNKNNSIYRLIRKCRDLIYRCLKNKKLYKTQSILGYSPEELKEYLEANFYGGMSWEVNNWEIHHIKPLSAFNFVNEDGTDNYAAIREANQLCNLMPLFIDDHKKITNLYNFKNKCLSKEEIRDFITRENTCSTH